MSKEMVEYGDTFGIHSANLCVEYVDEWKEGYLPFEDEVRLIYRAYRTCYSKEPWKKKELSTSEQNELMTAYRDQLRSLPQWNDGRPVHRWDENDKEYVIDNINVRVEDHVQEMIKRAGYERLCDHLHRCMFIKKHMNHESPLEHAKLSIAIDGMSRSCFDDQTEILTYDGWKLFKDLTIQDVYLTRRNDGSTEWQRAYRWIKYPFKGNLIQFRNKSFDVVVTPDHRMLTKKFQSHPRSEEKRQWNSSLLNYDFMTANDIMNEVDGTARHLFTKKIQTYNHTHPEFVEIPGYTYLKGMNNGTYVEKTLETLRVPYTPFIQFLAWYLSEGSVTWNRAEHSFTVTITQYDSEQNVSNRKEIEDCIRSMGFTPTSGSKSVHFKNRQLGRFLQILGKSVNKYIPFHLFTFFTQESAKLFIDTYNKADGSTDRSNHRKLYTTSKRLADQLQLLCFIAGTSAAVWCDDRVGESHMNYVTGQIVTHNFPCYVISISSGKQNINSICKSRKHVSVYPYDGMVYCVSVPNETIFVRRNGKCIWVGNCSHQLVRHRIASVSQASQRYINETDPDFVIPESIVDNPQAMKIFEEFLRPLPKAIEQLKELGIPHEDIRYLYPNAMSTSMVLTANWREWIHICGERTCRKAQAEIRTIANFVWWYLTETVPFIFDDVIPKCEKLGHCPEDKTCGRYAANHK